MYRIKVQSVLGGPVYYLVSISSCSIQKLCQFSLRSNILLTIYLYSLFSICFAALHWPYIKVAVCMRLSVSERIGEAHKNLLKWVKRGWDRKQTGAEVDDGSDTVEQPTDSRKNEDWVCKLAWSLKVIKVAHVNFHLKLA